MTKKKGGRPRTIFGPAYTPSVPLHLRNRLYQHYGYEYSGGKKGIPCAFWVLVQRLLNDYDALEKAKEK